jgi:hypothetical protein
MDLRTLSQRLCAGKAEQRLPREGPTHPADFTAKLAKK